MLEKIRFSNFSVNSSSFKMNGDPDSGGRYKVSFSEFGFKSEIDEDGDNWIEMAITSRVAGYEDGSDEPDPDETPIFEANFSLSIFFIVQEKSFEITEAFYKENSWFFKNYISMTCKLAAESILKYTPMYELELPWTPPFDTP